VSSEAKTIREHFGQHCWPQTGSFYFHGPLESFSGGQYRFPACTAGGRS